MKRAIWVLLGMAACVGQGSGRDAGGVRSAANVPEYQRMVDVAVAEQALCATGTCDRACEAGDVKACALAAERSWDGRRGHAFDPTASLRYATRDCDGGDALACALLGRHHANGVATAWAPAAAVAAFEKACQAGAGLGCLELAKMYRGGHGVDVDPRNAKIYLARAQRQFRAACDGSEPRWCVYVDRTENGDVPDDVARRTCARGVAARCVDVLVHRIGPAHPGAHARAHDGIDELDTLDRMCTAGEPSACVALADQVARDKRPGARARVVALTSRACELGDPEDCLPLGAFYDATGEAARADEVKRRSLDRLCERGSGHACLYFAQAAFLAGRADDVTSRAQRACELGEPTGCTMMKRHQLELHDDAAADRWAREGCRGGEEYDCDRLVDRDLELPWTPADEQKRLYRRGCGRGQAPACRRLTALERAEEPVLAALRGAVTRRDATAFGQLVAGDVELRDLWFESADCAARFGGTTVLTASARPGLLDCLASHGLRLEPHAGVGGGAALVYDPGVVLELAVTDGRLVQLATPRPWAARDNPAPIAAQPLASHLVAGTHTVEPDLDVRAAIAAAPDRVAGVELVVCVDTSGKVTMAVATPAHRGHAAYGSYVRAVEGAAAQWRFHPFEVHGKPVAVCARDVFAYPTDHLREVALASSVRDIRFEGGRRWNIAPEMLDSRRIAGEMNIVPDNVTKTQISVSGQTRLVGSFKLCLDEAGKISSVVPLKSTGFSAYDRKIVREVQTWRYSAFWLDGRPAAVCTAVTFVYSQH